ncbi:MAG: metal-dependent transcriptional regulator [Luteolibacter sp.]
MPKKAAPNPEKRSKLSAHHRDGLTESAEDYLECIVKLMERDGLVSISALAEELDLSKPSVSQMVKRLAESGYLVREPYRGFVLTAAGLSVAEAIQERHIILTELFKRLKLDPQKLQDDIEGIEHHVSDSTLSAMKMLVKHLDKHPL